MRRDKTPDNTTAHHSGNKHEKKRRDSSSSSSNSNSSRSSDSSSSSEYEEPSVKNKEAREDEMVMKINTKEVNTLYDQGKKSCIIDGVCKTGNSSYTDHLERKEKAISQDSAASDCRMNEEVTQKKVRNVEEKKRGDKEQGIPKVKTIKKIEWNGGKSSKDSKGSDV